VSGEAIDGGFSAVYPVFRMLEEGGRIRRGYFVDGLGAAQFALPGAVDRLRAMRDLPGEAAGEHGHVVHLLAAADPANAYGAALPWPRRDDADRRPFQRAAGAYVVLVGGEAAVYLERGGTSIATFPAADSAQVLDAALRALGALIADGRVRELVIAKLDGEPVASAPRRDALLGAGFVAGYRGLVLRGAGAAPERTYPRSVPVRPIR
jgi:ATP-dependent helicase Lhr and Lhr-like helicase